MNKSHAQTLQRIGLREAIFSGIGGKILLANSVGLIIFLFGALSVNFSRQSLTDVRLGGLIEQADMLAGALTANAEERRVNITLIKGANGIFLRPPIVAPDMRALFFNKEGKLIEDSDAHPPGSVKSYPLPDELSFYETLKKRVSMRWIALSSYLTGTEPPLFEETDGNSVDDFPEVTRVLVPARCGLILVGK
jgi:hypothetical protein